MSDIIKTKKDQIIDGVGWGIMFGCLGIAVVAAYCLADLLLAL